MKEIKFEREIKLLIYYIREYGIQHSAITRNDLPGSDAHKSFVASVHKGFMLAQDSVIHNLTHIINEKKSDKEKLKEANITRNKELIEKYKDLIERLEFQELCFRKIIDCISWIILNHEITDVRKLYGGEVPIDITSSNIESCIRYSKQVYSNNPLEFALISDLSSFVQVGDILHYKYGESLNIVELKEGVVNDKVFEAIDFYQKSQCDRFLYLTLDNENEKFQKQFSRVIKQLSNESEIVNTMKTGQGIDRLTGLKINTVQEKLELDSYYDVIKELLSTSKKKGYAISVVENCLSIGVYNNNKFPNFVFHDWMKCVNNEYPIYDLKQSLFDPVAYPLFIQPFSDSEIIDLMLGKLSIFMNIDYEKWLNPLEKEGYTVSWLSEKESRKKSISIKGGHTAFKVKGKIISIKKDNSSLMIQGGLLTHMFTLFEKPSSLRKYIKALLSYSQHEKPIDVEL